MCSELGYEKGERCNRNGCVGIIEEYETENTCTCHINPPCTYCTDSRSYCPVCNWNGREEQIEKDKKIQLIKADKIFKPRTIEDLDNTKIDWLSETHTHFSMIKQGVFPKGTTREEIIEKVKGTFGGRFTYFDETECKFVYIAYTD